MLAVNVAADIRRLTGRATIVVDLKQGPGDVALFLGLRPRHTLLGALDNLAWIDQSVLRRFVVEHDCGLHVLAAGDEYGRPGGRDADAVEQLLRALNTAFEFVILDVGSTLMAPSTTALQLSDSILLVGNPDVPCLRNLQRIKDAVKAAGVPAERMRFVLNRASEFGVLSTPQIERVLGVSIAHSVVSDYRTVASAVNSGVPLSSNRSRAWSPGCRIVRHEGSCFRRTTVAPRCDSGASQKPATSAWSRSRRCTAARCTPLPRP
jgi:pilus assembly protein CpaE